MDLEQTIVAISSAPGIGGRSIVRLSGAEAVRLALSVTLRPDDVTFSGSQVIQREICLPGERTLLADFWIWPTSRSYTRQPQVEIHLLGSRAIADLVLIDLRRAGARLAQPGEFTMRAFLAGRLDLTQAEAVLGVIDAHGEQRFQSALRQLSGGLSGPLQNARNDLIELLALLEAGLDFVEEDIEFIEMEELRERVTCIYDSLARLRDQIQSRSTNQSIPKVVLLGLPNAGKSSLFNALAGSDEAITSPVSGTTRDFITRKVHWQNVDLELVDTAGHELPEGDVIRKFMADQTRFATEDCDIGILCVDAQAGMLEQDRELSRRIPADQLLIVATKCDCLETECPAFASQATSAKAKTGIEALQQAIVAKLTELELTEDTLVPSSAIRCLGAIEETLGALATCLDGIAGYHSEELIASEIRYAIGQLSEVVGAVYTDDILDVIFSRFCIGK
ncbi:tRNA modification GTPase MnmE [Bremerella volcania]|uniref:tRNA modification GTPase MnmE n=1 Tax=Bremerella volcania TaxID=2527984 RepID=A0A518CA05_9BACT|nr:GTPase [Bremerella volcania]QDU76042.1 tRNA modification GTPase MnmE [Bremerella volcania]